MPCSVSGKTDLHVLHPGALLPSGLFLGLSHWKQRQKTKEREKSEGKYLLFCATSVWTCPIIVSFLFLSEYTFCTALFCLQTLVTAISSPLGLLLLLLLLSRFSPV